MQKFSKYLPIALFLVFFLLGFNVFLDSKPSPKNKRVYEFVKKYSPYYIEKRFGGLEILSKRDKEFKEKPDNTNFFKRLEELESNWGKKHLILKDNTLVVVDDNNKTIATLPLKDKKEIDFVKNYYKVK